MSKNIKVQFALRNEASKDWRPFAPEDSIPFLCSSNEESDKTEGEYAESSEEDKVEDTFHDVET